jgi:nitrile hydratase
MNGPQDMGGFTRFGPVAPEQDEALFHAEWEKRALAITLAMGATGTWNIDTSRHARERLPALQYWSSSYYRIWIAGLETLMTEAGLLTREEIEAGRPLMPPQPLKRKLMANAVPAVLARGGPSDRPSNRPQGFQLGERVHTRQIDAAGHTRLPRYARDKTGEIVQVHGTHVFPDSSAHGKGDDPHWLYTVRFSARELWGKATGDSVCIDLWEPYLEKAT